MALDPLSITVACTSLISSVSRLSTDIYLFVSRAQDAHRDLDAVLKEPSSLGLCLETLRNDRMATSQRVTRAPELRVLLVFDDTGEVVKDVNSILTNLSSNRSGNKDAPGVSWSRRHEQNKGRG